MPRPTAFMLAGLLFLLSIGTRLVAQDFSSGEGKISSGNLEYYAIIKTRPEGTVEAQVFETVLGLPIWTKWIECEKNDIVMLSNDGRSLVVINPEYGEENSLVRVYWEKTQKAFTVKNIVIPKELLKRSGKSFAWYEADSAENGFVYGTKGEVKGFRLRLLARRTIQLDF